MLYTTIFWFCFCLWIYLLSVLKRAHLSGYYFIVGSVGLFGVFIFLGQSYLVWLFSASLTYLAGMIGSFFGFFTSADFNILQVFHGLETMSLYIDFECSGLIETTAFIGLIAFYPLYAPKERLSLALAGSLYIYIAELIRILFIAIFLHYSGSTYFYLVHSILGRMLFYFMVITLYYNIFTRSHIVSKFLHSTRGLANDV